MDDAKGNQRKGIACHLVLCWYLFFFSASSLNNVLFTLLLLLIFIVQTQTQGNFKKSIFCSFRLLFLYSVFFLWITLYHNFLRAPQNTGKSLELEQSSTNNFDKNFISFEKTLIMREVFFDFYYLHFSLPLSLTLGLWI